MHVTYGGVESNRAEAQVTQCAMEKAMLGFALMILEETQITPRK